jgi:hypothetical protein
MAASNEWREHAYPLQQITIKLQGTRRSDRTAILQQLDGIAARLRAGEITGQEDDDDFGYQFKVEGQSNGPSFFDDASSSAPVFEAKADEPREEGEAHFGTAAYRPPKGEFSAMLTIILIWVAVGTCCFIFLSGPIGRCVLAAGVAALVCWCLSKRKSFAAQSPASDS